MRISSHKLVDEWFGESPNIGGTLSNPSILVMHFTASGGPDGKGDANYFKTRAAKTSAHIIVGRDGSIYQVVPFNKKAWHAGKSIWRGVPNCNDYSIGIEIDNWGKLLRTADGKYRSWTKQEVDPADVVKMRHKAESTDSYWETYDPKQMDALEDLVEVILAAYPSIKEIVGHDDISPGRKTDPGPAFPMNRFRNLLDGRKSSTAVIRTTTSNLNVRSGPSLAHRVVRILPKGTKVTVLYDAPGEWAQTPHGWVNDRYLA